MVRSAANKVLSICPAIEIDDAIRMSIMVEPLAEDPWELARIELKEAMVSLQIRGEDIEEAPSFDTVFIRTIFSDPAAMFSFWFEAGKASSLALAPFFEGDLLGGPTMATDLVRNGIYGLVEWETDNRIGKLFKEILLGDPEVRASLIFGIRSK